MQQKVTIYDIAKKLNITAATVSRALNNNPKISQKTRELVMKTASEMNYKQNKLAQALKSGKTNNVGVIVPFINHNFFSSAIMGIEEELTPQGYHVIICQSHENVKNEEEQINTLLNTQIDAIFISVSETTNTTEHLRKVINNGTPLIFFDRKLDIPGVSSVTIDDYKGAYMATQHLIEQGCKRIAHFAGDVHLQIYLNRYEGYKAALRDHGLEPDEELVVTTKSKIEEGSNAVKELWKLKEKPDAIFCAGDYTALGAIQELKEMGIKVPDEVCVSGFSNEPFTKYMELPITSVDQTPVEMGKIAAQVFLEQISDDRSISIEKKVVLSPELFIRKSSLRKG